MVGIQFYVMGHNIDLINKSFNKIRANKPNIIIFKTIKGKGIKFMENNNDWHHGRLTKNLYLTAINDLKKLCITNLKISNGVEWVQEQCLVNLCWN